MAYPDACIYSFTPTGLRAIAYEDTDHYLVTRGFLTNPQRTLSILFVGEQANDGK